MKRIRVAQTARQKDYGVQIVDLHSQLYQRKTFSQRFYEASHNVEFLRELLGHKTLNGISDYVTIPYNDLREAVKAIELSRR